MVLQVFREAKQVFEKEGSQAECCRQWEAAGSRNPTKKLIVILYQFFV